MGKSPGWLERLEWSRGSQRWGGRGLWRGLLGEAWEEATATIQPEVMVAWIQGQVREPSSASDSASEVEEEGPADILDMQKRTRRLLASLLPVHG